MTFLDTVADVDVHRLHVARDLGVYVDLLKRPELRRQNQVVREVRQSCPGHGDGCGLRSISTSFDVAGAGHDQRQHDSHRGSLGTASFVGYFHCGYSKSRITSRNFSSEKRRDLQKSIIFRSR